MTAAKVTRVAVDVVVVVCEVLRLARDAWAERRRRRAARLRGSLSQLCPARASLFGANVTLQAPDACKAAVAAAA
jgi:hypothetical protein